MEKAKENLVAGLDLGKGGGMLRGNLAYVHWLLGEPQEAEQNYTQALIEAHSTEAAKQLYELTIVDIAMHSIEEDANFRKMVDRVWSKYQVG